uniref:Uncharacterized protein n=1 Tax=Knipowitschia caucasica TaxID=637954 RepID=A0AAV2MS95_KNICA
MGPAHGASGGAAVVQWWRGSGLALKGGVYPGTTFFQNLPNNPTSTIM